uniref:Uncharacterized protein n=1 Tax=Anguilla anguilla TaxID=7936 RepID=A0A0E9WI58_ANGAN
MPIQFLRQKNGACMLMTVYTLAARILPQDCRQLTAYEGGTLAEIFILNDSVILTGQ